MKFLLKLFLPFVLVFAPGLSFANDNFRDVGYFKDGEKNRLFTVELAGNIDPAMARSYANKKMNTDGQVTAVYFYDYGSRIPADGITNARSLFHANTTLYDTPGLSKWVYAYMKGMDGRVSFVDCRAKPSSDLCRR